jgi:glycerol-1-phosphate dehydrogenase [NAD(P)+]
MSDWRAQMRTLVAPALARSAAIDEIIVEAGALDGLPALFRRRFGERAFLVADENTWTAAGARAAQALEAAGVAVDRRILPASPRPKPTRELGDELAAATPQYATPVAVGSGVLNDVVKYAAFRRGRPYLCVATAASMDGYSSAGAPLVDAGFKKTIACAPPRAIVADLDVIAAAPKAMAGWGYGDLAGKAPAGGDWIVADALGIEPIDAVAWPMVQDNLADWLRSPRAVAAGDGDATAALFIGLTIAGLAMEAHGTSRPASGADHQIAHLWEMDNLEKDGERVSHGACVSVGALDALALFDWLIDQDLAALDAPAVAAAAASLDDKWREIAQTFPDRAIAERAEAETAAKHLDRDAHVARIEAVRAAWPALRRRLAERLPRAAAMREKLAEAGAPVSAEAIGVDPDRHRATIRASRLIRSRYTVLDLIDESGLLEPALDAVAPGMRA